MASLLPVALQAVQAFQTVSSVASVVGSGLDVFDNSAKKEGDQAVEHLRQQQRVQQRQAENKAVLDKQEILAKAESAERERRKSLKRAVARQRASFGASGVSSGDGSSEAVLLGMFEESDDDRKSRERLDNVRLLSIDQSVGSKKRVNTLERTQLAEKKKLKNSTSTLDTVTDLFSIF